MQWSTSYSQSNHFPNIPGKIRWPPYTISNDESQMPFPRFFLRGGGSVHRLSKTLLTLCWLWFKILYQFRWLHHWAKTLKRCGALLHDSFIGEIKVDVIESTILFKKCRGFTPVVPFLIPHSTHIIGWKVINSCQWQPCMLPFDFTLNMLLYNEKRTRLLSSHRRQFIVETFTKYFHKPNRAIAMFFTKTLRKIAALVLETEISQ